MGEKFYLYTSLQHVAVVAALLLISSVLPQQAIAHSDKGGAQGAYLNTTLGLVNTALFAKGVENYGTMWAPQVPTGGESAIKLMQGFPEGHVEVRAPLNSARIAQIEELIRIRKPYTVSLSGEHNSYSIFIKYDKKDRPINMSEVRATLNEAKASKTPIGLVTIGSRNRGTIFLRHHAPSVPMVKKSVRTARKVAKTAGWLSALPLTAWLVDKGAETAGVPQSRNGFVADRFEKVLDSVVEKFNPGSSGKTKANGAN